jgi:hypothetical protein
MVMGEHGSANFTATGVTYGGQVMTKQTEKLTGSTARNYAAIFTLNESGVNAANSGLINVTWSTAPSGFNVYSVLLGNVNQSSPFSTSNNALTGTTITAYALTSGSGDMLIQCGATASNHTITFNNGITKSFESNASWGDATGGYKTGTGVNEIPGYSQSKRGQMVICAMVAKKATAPQLAPHVVTGFDIPNDNNNSISVYPNPASGYLNIAHNQDAEIRIYDLRGVLQISKNSKGNSTVIDVSNFKQSGMYLVQIVSDNLTKVVKVSIIK